MQRAFKRDTSKTPRKGMPKVRHISKRKNERVREYFKRAVDKDQKSKVETLNDVMMKDLIDSALENEERVPYNLSKVMFMGEASQGKTATINTLLGKDFNTAQSDSRVQVFDVDAVTWERYEKATDIPEDKLTYNIWDFSAERVFNVLHHLFMTEFTLYVIIFDARKILQEESRADTISKLKFWLFSKKVHASSAPVLLVGTFCDGLTEKELGYVDEVLTTDVLGSSSFGEAILEKFCFLPIDNQTGMNGDLLKKKISDIVLHQKYTKEDVVAKFLHVFKTMVDLGKAILDEGQVEKIMQQHGIEDEDVSSLCLQFLARRGLIIYFHQHNLLRRFVIINPEWLIEALGDVIFDHHLEGKPDFDAKHARDYRKFKKDGVLSKQLLFDIWKHNGYDYRLRKFLLRVLLMRSLIGEYNFDNRASFLIPRLFNDHATQAVQIDESIFEGPSFVLDFSGEFDAEIVADDGEMFVKYLPFGLFERLVCLCVEHSARFEDSRHPLIGYKIARLSFGVEVDFILKTGVNHNGEPLRIQIFTETDTSYSEAQELVKTLYSMTEGLKVDLFSTASNGGSKLAMTLLLPSTKESGEILASYKTLKVQREAARGKDKKIRPSKMHGKKILLSAYDMWFGDARSLTPTEGLAIPIAAQVSSDPTTTALKPLPKDLEYHCFLSYKQSSAIDIVGKQFFILKSLGYKCWYDQEHKGELNLESMQEGVRKSMCYILFLSEDIFPSRYVEEEVKIAVEEKKPIVFLHHPDTGRLGFWGFHQYIEKAPEILKPYFATVESIQLQRRYYLEEAVTQLLSKRLQAIYDQSC